MTEAGFSFVPGDKSVGEVLRDLADQLSGTGTGEQFVREVEGGFEAPNHVVEYYARVTVTPTGVQEPIEPDNGGPHPDNTLPGPGSAGGEHPDNTLPEPEPQPEEPDPNAPYPDNTLPGPGSAGGEHPDNTLPEPEPHPDHELPGPGSAGGEHPDNTLPEPEPEPEEPDVEEPEPEEPGNPLEPPIGRPDENWTVAELKAWAAENGVELATGLRKDDILVVINQSLGD
jgi:hypothetical protein